MTPNLLISLAMLLLYAHSLHAASHTGCSPQDLTALQAWKAQFNVSNPAYAMNLSDWVGTNCCAWDSVQCSGGRVIDVSLYGDGKVPIPAALCKLSKLQYLVAYAVGGDIPACLGDLAELKALELLPSLNETAYPESMPVGTISGTIPLALCKLSRLEQLVLLYGPLEGNIPACFGNLTELTLLVLGWNNLSGTIPSSLCNLNKLWWLDMSYNSLQGDIPACLGNLSELTLLSLKSNNLSRTIPSSLCHLNKLRTLDLSNNSLQGDIPACSGNLSELTLLNLGSNHLSGAIPSTLWSLPTLQYLDLSSNDLEGSLQPSSVSNLSTTIQYLILNDNRFSGILPAALFQLSSLSSLVLSSNLLIGSIPSEWANFTQITYIALSDNSLRMGHLPSWLLNLPLLIDLELRSCGISAVSCPRNGSLSYLDLSNNTLSGGDAWHCLLETPLELDPSGKPSSSRLPSQMEALLLSSCNLSGNLPPFSGNSLHILSLKNNSLEGKIPEELGQMSSLHVLLLNDNSLEGQIPDGFGNMTSLLVLNLNGNKFSGHVPRLWNCGSLRLLDLGSNNLQGTLQDLTAHSNISNLQVLVLASNHMDGPIPDNFGSFSDVLQVIDLSNNSFSGPIPLNLQLTAFSQRQAGAHAAYKSDSNFYEFKIIAKSQELDYTTILVALLALNLQGNRLTGTIPTSLGNLTYIVYLNLARNSLHGNIPGSLSNLTSLEGLALPCNSLSGPIPANFSKYLTFLADFSVAYNNLSGPIPQGNQFANTFTNLSYEGNAGLCDFNACERYHILNRPCTSSPAPQNGTLPSHNRVVAFLKAYPLPALAVGYSVGLVGTLVSFLLLKKFRRL